MNTKLFQLIRDGEGLTVEFKRCARELPKSVYKTVCAFSNRYGGYILLGVEDDGEISGIAPDAVSQIKKDFVSVMNNAQRFSPTLFISLEEAKIDGKIMLWCYVPFTSQLVMFGGRIYDRAEDGDFDVTHSPELLGMIVSRKQGASSENKIFPYATDSELLLEKLMPQIRQLALSRNDKHPWGKLPDREIMQSAGLYQTDHLTGKSGYTLAAILIFGHDEIIRSCLPGYVTDCILRRENLDRYDDRLMVSCNLIEAFDKIMDFIAKHTLDKFYMEGVQSVSVRSKIARELVSNIIVHREYTSSFPAKVIIDRNRIATENWCMPKRPGKLDPDSFTPQPKNPLLANFFVNIGYADTLGSGVRNLYKYTKIYSGGEPELIEGDVFRTIVPLGIYVSDKMSDKMSDKSNTADKKYSDALLAHLADNGEISTAEAASIIGRSTKTARRVLLQLAREGLVRPTGGNRNRKYKANR
ncbi:MAG: putative DNA binding domain-containing protein [Gracilibacteraceae bacterium]|jgi:ATP-dependent DNA helicase RecG|nr:putative DNA binding domain-containing protein [Gracilibacteraceae bacterium]